MLISDTRNKDQKFPYKRYLDALVVSNVQMEDIATIITNHNFTPFPKNLQKTIETIQKEYASSGLKEVADYPLDIRTMIYNIQRAPGGNHVYINQAFEMLSDLSVRRWVNSMAMANLNADLIYMLVSAKTDKIYEEGSYVAYLNYFFNLQGLTMKEKQDIISAEKDPELVKNYQLAMQYDKEKLLWKLGFTPEMSVSDLVKIVAVDSVMRFKDAIDEDKAAKLGTLVLKAAEKLREIDQETKKSMEDVGGFDIQLLRENPNVKRLTDLNYGEVDGN